MRIPSVLLALVMSCLAVPVIVPASPAAAAPAAPADCGSPPAPALTDYFDRAMPGALSHHHVPGAVVSVVSGDATVLSKGYGLADREHAVAFDPDRSLVRIASITKLFTWTAVMQQVQAGRLDLNADVNRYLTGFKIPATYAQPVTLQTLMDHTSGFEDKVIGTAARTAADVTPWRSTWRPICRPGSGRRARSRRTPTTASRWPAISWPRSAASPTTATSGNTCSGRWA